jgi:hypothetical protein
VLISIPEQRALDAIAKGDVTHVFTAKRNFFDKPRGVGETAIEKLYERGWAADGNGAQGLFRSRFKVLLTEKGEIARDSLGQAVS